MTLPLPVTAMVCSGGWSVAPFTAQRTGAGGCCRAECRAGDEADREGRHAGDRHPAEGRAARAAHLGRQSSLVRVHRSGSRVCGGLRCADRWVPLPGRPLSGSRRRWVAWGFHGLRGRFPGHRRPFRPSIREATTNRGSPSRPGQIVVMRMPKRRVGSRSGHAVARRMLGQLAALGLGPRLASRIQGLFEPSESAEAPSGSTGDRPGAPLVISPREYKAGSATRRPC